MARIQTLIVFFFYQSPTQHNRVPRGWGVLSSDSRTLGDTTDSLTH